MKIKSEKLFECAISSKKKKEKRKVFVFFFDLLVEN
jgi:hypothetical protein